MGGIGGSVLAAVGRADQIPLRVSGLRDEGVRRRQISLMYQAFGASGRGGRGRWPPAILRGDRCPAAAPPLRPTRARRAEPEAAGQRGSEGKWPH